ncbi:MAG: hypothetical protein RI885_2268 [Actinomycetota bacterium]|jgi:hypothetical protein
MAETLLTEALLSVDEAEVYLKITPGTATELLTRLINYVTGQFELHTLRHLKTRAYSGNAMLVDGEGTNEIDAKEWPVTLLSAIKELALDGTVLRTLNISGARISAAGTIYLMNDVLAEGSLNHQLELTAGYVATSADWKAITGAALRYLQFMYVDQANVIGRGATISVGGESTSLPDIAMPKDVLRALAPFVRLL